MTFSTPEKQGNSRTISPAEASSELHKFLILDVRTPAEFEDAHIEGSLSTPLDTLDPQKIKELAKGKTSYLFICRSGKRARQAAEKLLTDVPHFILEGGLQAWENSGLPLRHGKKMISLERQVRIASGALVLTGALLGYFVHPAWIALSGFVGAGLIFAGITDSCGMGMLMAKMPWNTCSKSNCNTKS